MIDQTEIHRKANSISQEDRKEAVDALVSAFGLVPDQEQAWKDLHRLAQDEDSNVRWGAAEALGISFGLVPDKNQAWKDLISLTQDEDHSVRMFAAHFLETAFGLVPDKDQVWKDLISLAQDEDNIVRWSAATALGISFGLVLNKDQAWKDLHSLIQDEKGYVRSCAAEALGTAFGQVPDKDQAWRDLHKLTQDKARIVRGSAAASLGIAFGQVPNKDQAWRDLHKLTQDKDRIVQGSAAASLGIAFGQVPKKDQAWKDMHRLTQDKDRTVRGSAAKALGIAFGLVPNKDLAWKDLIRLTGDEESNIRWRAAAALRTAFELAPGKDLAWKDLIRLAQDEDNNVRWPAAAALGTAFRLVPDKGQAWKDLINLTRNGDRIVRWGASEALGIAFGQIPNKDLAWKDLHSLTQDKDAIVRMYAYHSLGRISVLKATEVKGDDWTALKRELDAAVKYFEKSSQESKYSPASFCYPFYRTYYAIAFQGAEGDEVKKYLAEAKNAVGGSESKDELLKAVENLAHALEESQRLKERSLREISGELNAYRWYCEKAAGHMYAAEDKAPGAVKLMRRCNPLLEEQIQLTIAEIQKSAKKICQLTHGSGTEYEAPGAEIQQAARYLDSDDISLIQKSSAKIVRQLKKFCRLLLAEDKEEVCDIVEDIEHEPEFPEKLNKIATALRSLSPVLEEKSPLVDVVVLTVLQEEYYSICNRLAEPGLPPGLDSTPNLYAWQSGNVFCQNFQSDYRIAVGMIGRPGTTESALAAREAVQLWRPRYILFSGIAGGLPYPIDDDALPKLGDVVVADMIYGYEYGKIDKKFLLRTNWTYRTDKALLNGAIAYSRSDGWRKSINAKPPAECYPKVISGEISSGNKVIDNPSNSFFKQVLKMWPKIKAVKMEGAGVAGAIEQAQSLGIPTGFMMIRGISDLPRAEGKDRGTKERDAWKIYASDVAAAFIIGWISNGLPVRPSARSTQ